MTVNPLSAYLSDVPPEWDVIPPEILAQLRPAGGITSPEQRAAINRIAAGRWFLVRNDLRSRCGSCRQGTLPGAIHEYISIRCVEAPFNGLREVVLFMREHRDGNVLFSAMKAGTLVPITRDKARQLNARILERGGVPISAQLPIDASEIDADSIARSIARRAALVNR